MVAGAWRGLHCERVRSCGEDASPGARSPWAMLARSLGGDEAPGVDARRDADDAPEVPVELALVVEADGLRGVGDEHAAPEQLPGAGDPEVGQVLVRGQPDLGAEGAHQVELVERRVLRRGRRG